MRTRFIPPVGVCLLALLWLPGLASATTYNVGSLSDLSAKISSAVAGDTIILSNGVYAASSTITVNRNGTAANPILICAQTIGGAEITGSGGGISMSGSASYIIVQGFKLTHSSGIGIPHGASHIQYTRNIVQLTIPATNDVSYFNISADDVTIDHNELRNKSTLGEMLDISGSGSQVARRLWVHHNYFHDFTSPGGNGAETIRWGLSGLSLSTGNGLCEYNLFVRCKGENEMISNKSSGNTYRFNTMLDCVGGEISQRHGNDCYYYGNYLRNNQGMRIYGDRHRIFSNYFESNSIGVNMGNGDGDVYNGAALTAHDRPDDNVVVYNTFVNNSTHYEMGGRTGGLGSSNSVVANNVFQGGGNIASISSSAPYTGSWSNNIIWQVGSTGNMPSSGYRNVNPLLVKDSSGAYHIQSGSPAINTGVPAADFYGTVSTFSYITNDMDGQPRDASKDVGADEFSAAPILAHLLSTNEVGPLAYDGLQFSLAATPASQTVLPNSNVTYAVNVTALNGTTGVVALAVSGLPAHVGAAFSPVSVTNTGSSTLTVFASNSVPFGSYTLTISGASSNNTQTASVTLVIGDFLVAASPASQVVVHGSNAVFTVTVTTNSAFTGTVVLGASGLPPGATAGFVPPSLSGSGSSTLTIATSTNDPGGTYALTITGTGGNSGGSAGASASLTVSGDVAAPGWLMWKGTNNWSLGNNWTNVNTGGAGAPGIANDVVFADLATVPGSNTVNSIVDGDATINSLVFTNTAGFHTVQINPGRTLSIVGTNTYQGQPALNVGMDTNAATAVTVRAGITGINGTLAISNAAAAIQVRQGIASGLVGSLAILDLSGLGTFNADLRRIQIGSESGAPRRVAGAVYLARTNSIVIEQALDVNATNWSSGTPALILGHNTQSGNTNGSVLYLGISNAIYVNHIVTGRGNQTNNLIAFNPAFLSNNPSLYLRGSDGVSRVGQWTLGDNSAGSLTVPSSGTNDFTGGTVDARVDRLLVGRGRTGNTTNLGFGTVTFDNGTLDVNTLRLGTMIDESSSTNASGVGTANVNGSALLTVNTILELAHTNTTAPATVSAIAGTLGTLNVNGGTVQATNVVGAGGVSIINLNSGTLDLQPDWAATPGRLANISTLNIGAAGIGTPALLSDAASISSPATITIASNGVLRGSTVVTAPALIVNGAISPGSGAGTLTNSGSATFASGGRYIVELSDTAAGLGNGWDYFRTAGALNITATSGSPFTLQLTSLNGSDPGDASNFNPDTNYNFSIASAGGAISGFDTTRMALDTASFGNDLEGGYFFIRTNGASLVLSFTNNHPPLAAVASVSRTGTTVVIPIASLVTNWSDADGDPVSLLDVAASSTNGVNNVGFDAVNIYYTNATMITDAITYTVADVRTNPPAAYRASDTQRTSTGTILILPVVPPSLDNIQLSGGSVVLTGTGAAGGSYYVMTSTNLTVPFSNWSVIATGQFDNVGNFHFTNAIDANKPQLFYRLQVP
jgi:hypothetical protein